eukprot:sb/3465790/
MIITSLKAPDSQTLSNNMMLQCNFPSVLATYREELKERKKGEREIIINQLRMRERKRERERGRERESEREKREKDRTQRESKLKSAIVCNSLSSSVFVISCSSVEENNVGSDGELLQLSGLRDTLNLFGRRFSLFVSRTRQVVLGDTRRCRRDLRTETPVIAGVERRRRRRRRKSDPAVIFYLNIQSDPDLVTSSGERVLVTKSGWALNWGQIPLISYIGGNPKPFLPRMSLNRGPTALCLVAVWRGGANEGIVAHSWHTLQALQDEGPGRNAALGGEYIITESEFTSWVKRGDCSAFQKSCRSLRHPRCGVARMRGLQRIPKRIPKKLSLSFVSCFRKYNVLIVGALRSFAAKSRAPPFLRIISKGVTVA